MPDNNKALIPFAPDLADLAPAHRDFQLRVFTERRELALDELRRWPDLTALASELKPDRVYRLVIPDGAVLQKGKDGLYSGVVYGDGKIVKHARFEKLSPDLARVASAVGSQILLVSIAMQLNRVENAIAATMQGLQDDRIAQIVAGARQYQAAMQIVDGERRDVAMQHAIQSLNEGVARVSRGLRTEIHALPEPSSTFWDNWVASKADHAATQLRKAEASLGAAVSGVSILSQCYAALDEPQAGAFVIGSCLSDIPATDIKRAAECARLVEVQDPNRHPETPWNEFNKARLAFERAARQLPAELDELGEGTVEVEFEARELMEKR